MNPSLFNRRISSRLDTGTSLDNCYRLRGDIYAHIVDWWNGVAHLKPQGYPALYDRNELPSALFYGLPDAQTPSSSGTSPNIGSGSSMTLYSALSRAAMIYSANMIKTNLERIRGNILRYSSRSSILSSGSEQWTHPPPGPPATPGCGGHHHRPQARIVEGDGSGRRAVQQVQGHAVAPDGSAALHDDERAAGDVGQRGQRLGGGDGPSVD